MDLDWQRALVVVGLSAAAQGCEVVPPQGPRPDVPEFAYDVPRLGQDLSTTDAGTHPDASPGIDRDPLDVGAPTDISPWGDPPPDASAWPDDGGTAPFVDAAEGPTLAGGPSLPPFRLLVDADDRAQIALSPAGTLWLLGVTALRVTRYDRSASPSALTVVDPTGAVIAQHAARGSLVVQWVEPDAAGALVAVDARGPVSLGDLTWDADADGEGVLLRYDARGAVRWQASFPGARVLPGSRVEGDRAAVVVSALDRARIGDQRIVGPRYARVDVDERGAVSGVLGFGAASLQTDAQARPLRDGGATLVERVGVMGTITQFDARGVARWRRAGPLEESLLDEAGSAFILTREDLFGMDRDGMVRWRVPAHGFTFLQVAGVAVANRGRELRDLGDAIAVVQRMEVTPESNNWDLSACYPPGPQRDTLSASFYDRQGHEIIVEGGWYSPPGRAIAWSPGRTCRLRRDLAARGLLSTQPRSGTLACDRTISPDSCGDEARCNACSADLLRDDANCGACGRRCDGMGGTLGRCIRGVCVHDRCDETHADCDGRTATGCEVDLARDGANCGACGNACPAGRSCDRGRCATTGAIWWSDGGEGDFAPTRDTVLPSGIHHLRTISIPIGVTVRTTSDGVLDLRATGDVRIAGTIDLSGGDGEGASPRAVGGSTAGAPRSAPGSRGAGPAGGGGSGDADGEGLAPGRRGPERIPIGGNCNPRESASCGRNSVTLGELPAYDGDCVIDCQACTPEGGGLHLCSLYTIGGSGGGGSIGERAVLDLAVASTFTLGSGGGASGNGGNGAGGAGGGALRISSGTRIVLDAGAALLARGGRGGVPEGGPGSGGVIILAAPEVRTAAGSRVSAAGGGTNGLGRIRVTADTARCSLVGSFVPPLRDGCAPTNTMGFTYVSAWR